MSSTAIAARPAPEPLFRQTLTFGMPLVVAMFLGALFNLVDLYIVARMDDPQVAVAAVTFGSLVNSIPHIIFNGIINAMLALVARYHGLGSRNKASVAAGQGLTLTVVLSFAFGLPPFLYAEEICRLLGAAGPVVAPATDYLAIMSAGTITMFLLLQVTGVLRAVGNSLIPLLLLGGSNVLNIILDIWFIFGGLGLEPMGVAGAAWATVAARLVFAVIGLAILYRGFLGIRLRRWMWNTRIQWDLLRIGIPSCMQWLVRMVSYLYILGFVAEAAPLAGVAATDAQAAFGVGLRLDSLVLFSGSGWGAAAATLVGLNLGRGRRDRAVRASWMALGLNMCMMLVFAGVYVLFADPLLQVMGFDVGEEANSSAVMDIGRTYLYVAAAGYVYLAVAVTFSQALAGAGATKFPMVLEVLAYGAIGYPLVQWAANNADVYGLRAVWLAAVALHLGVAIAYVIWFRLGFWTRKEIR